MKAFILNKDKKNMNLDGFRLLINNLSEYGQVNCNFIQFLEIYHSWHKINFPKVPVSIDTVNCTTEFYMNFIDYISNYELEGDVGIEITD
jgi:hypothetical protein